jgi:hypothetical protein
MWETQRNKYIEVYILGKKQDIKTIYTDYGNKFDHAMETGEDTPDDEVINLMKEFVPRYELMQHILEVMVETNDGWFIMMGKPDTCKEDYTAFRDYKTAKKMWSQKMVENSNQFLHYASIIWLETRKIPSVYVDCLETVLVDQTMSLTGRYEVFERKIQLKEILEYIAKCTRYAKEIQEVYLAHLNEK